MVEKEFELEEILNNNSVILYNLCENIPFTQEFFYGDWQKKNNRNIRRFVIRRKKEVLAYFQIICYPLIFKKKYLYIPYGPVIKIFSENILNFIKKNLLQIAKQNNAIFVRLDFTPTCNQIILEKIFKLAPLYTYHSAFFQPRAEWFLKLDIDSASIFMQMDKKTRYSINLSEKRGVQSEIVNYDFEKYFPIFWELMTDTATRNHFNLHPKKYYEDIFKSLPSIPNSYLVIAKYNLEILAISVVIVFDKVANYVLGASSSLERTREPSYSAQWLGIKHAKKISCDYYNFGGVSTANDNHKSWDNLSTFKRRFGGEVRQHSPLFDIIVNHFWYYIYTTRHFFKK